MDIVPLSELDERRRTSLSSHDRGLSEGLALKFLAFQFGWIIPN